MARRTYECIRHHSLIQPNKVGLVDLYSDRHLTYREIDQRVDALARHIRKSFDLKADDCIAVLCHNSTDIMEVQFACTSAPGALSTAQLGA